MFVAKILSFRGGVVLTTVAALLSSVAVQTSAVQARPAAPLAKDVSAATAVVGEATDFSARRRVNSAGFSYFFSIQPVECRSINALWMDST
jgi:hypothetical protein